jgi:uncharacterized membrane protein YebE (DUF533 family)
MFDPKALLDQVLGGSAAGGLRNAGQSAKGRLDQYSGSGGFMRGAAAGGLLGLLLGGKGLGKMAGGVVSYGGAAALGALALKAYQDYQQKKSPAAASLTPDSLAALSDQTLPHAQLAAAKADGHIDADEHQRLFNEVERMGLDAEAKAAIFELLSQPVDLQAITAAVATPEQGAEVYLASRLAMTPDQPAERAYLDALAGRLKLPVELRAHLDASSS